MLTVPGTQQVSSTGYAEAAAVAAVSDGHTAFQAGEIWKEATWEK